MKIEYSILMLTNIIDLFNFNAFMLQQKRPCTLSSQIQLQETRDLGTICPEYI